MQLIESKDPKVAGFAAEALGELGNPDAEPKLIAALADDSSWRQAQACGALGKIGTQRAVEPLQKLANFEGYTGAINFRDAAKAALENIAKWNARPD